MIIRASEGGRIVAVDAELEHFLGYKTGALLGQPLTKIIPPRFRAAHSDAMSRFLESGEKTVMGSWVRVAILTADDHELPVKFVVTEDGNELVAIFTDG